MENYTDNDNGNNVGDTTATTNQQSHNSFHGVSSFPTVVTHLEFLFEQKKFFLFDKLQRSLTSIFFIDLKPPVESTFEEWKFEK